MFIMTGMFQGRSVTIKYNDVDKDDPRKGYILTGDQSVIEKAKYENTREHGYLGPVPEEVNTDYLFYELPARDLLRTHVFESVISEENDD